MRFLTTALAISAIALAFTACTGKSSSDTDQSNAAATSAAATSAAAEASPCEASASSGAASSAMTKTDEIPAYPGATTQAAGSSEGMGGTTAAAGKVMTTTDSFATVYAWYQKNMPAGSEKAHVTSPVESAVFTLGDPSTRPDVGDDQHAGRQDDDHGRSRKEVATERIDAGGGPAIFARPATRRLGRRASRRSSRRRTGSRGF